MAMNLRINGQNHHVLQIDSSGSSLSGQNNLVGNDNTWSHQPHLKPLSGGGGGHHFPQHQLLAHAHNSNHNLDQPFNQNIPLHPLHEEDQNEPRMIIRSKKKTLQMQQQHRAASTSRRNNTYSTMQQSQNGQVGAGGGRQQINPHPQRPISAVITPAGSGFRTRRTGGGGGLLEREMQLQEEIKTCKQERNMSNRENVFLRTQIKNLEKELNRKDGVIKQLIGNESLAQLDQESSAVAGSDLVDCGKVVTSQSLHNSCKNQIKTLKAELLARREELLNVTRTLKYTRLRELEATLNQTQAECTRLKDLLTSSERQQQILQLDTLGPLQAEIKRLQQLQDKSQTLIAKLSNDLTLVTKQCQDQNDVIGKLNQRLYKALEKALWYRGRFENSQKKIRVLQSKVMEYQKLQLGVATKRAGRVEVTTSSKLQKSSAERSTGSHSRSPKNAYQRQSSNGQISGLSSAKSKNRADWFEQYAVEKAKNERILSNLRRLNINIDLNELYQREGGCTGLINVQEHEIESTSPKSPSSPVNLQIVSRPSRGMQPPQNNINKSGVVISSFGEEDSLDRQNGQEIENLLKEVRIKMQIKRVPHSNLVSYLFLGMPAISSTSNKKQTVTAHQLQTQLMKRLKMSSASASKLTQYFLGGNTLSSTMSQLKKSILTNIKPYTAYSGLQITQMLRRVTEDIINEEVRQKINDSLKEAADDEGNVLMSKFWEIIGKQPSKVKKQLLSEDVRQFLEYLLFRQSDSLIKMNQYQFMEIFEEGYLIDQSPYEDSQDLGQENGGGISGGGDPTQLTENDLMLFMDSVLAKICSHFSEHFVTVADQQTILEGLSLAIRPYLKGYKGQEEEEEETYLTSEDLHSFFIETLGMSQHIISHTEMEYITHVLGREDMHGIIVFREFEQIVRNFIQKERIFAASIIQGIRYDVISRVETYEYLVRLRQLDTPIKRVVSKSLVTQQTVKSTSQGGLNVVEVVDFNAFLDDVKERYQIAPPRNSLELQCLFCIDPKYQDLVLLNKVERIIETDFDHVYINLLQLTRVAPDSDYVLRYRSYAPSQNALVSKIKTQEFPSDIEEEEEDDGVEDFDDKQQKRRAQIGSTFDNPVEEVETSPDKRNPLRFDEEQIEEELVDDSSSII